MHSKNRPLSGWGNYPQINSNIITPQIEKDILQLPQHTNSIARGLGRSYADQALNQNGFTVDFTRLNKFMAFDSSTGLLECEAGVSLEDIISTFAPRGWFPPIVPGTKFVTVGGAIANDIHGKAHHVDGTFAACVQSIRIMLATGEIILVSREHNADLFWATFGGLGLTGFIISAQLQLVKIETTFFIKKALKIGSLSEMLQAFEDYDADYNYSVAWIDTMARGKKLGRGVLSLGNRARTADLNPNITALQLHPHSKLNLPVFLPNSLLNKFTVKILNQVLAQVQNSKAPIAHYEPFFFPLDAIHNWNRGYGKRGFIQYQFVIPIQVGLMGLESILKRINASDCVPFLNVLKKFGTHQSGILSFPMPGYTLAIDFPITRNLAQLTADLDQMILHMGGRIYLGKDAMLSESVFKQMYPEFESWLQIKQKYDPTNFFTSNLGRRLGLSK